MNNILVINRKGGCGKTLISDEIAFAFDRMNIPYNFYDLDGQGGVIHSPNQIDNAVASIIDTPGALQSSMGDWIDDADLIIIPTRPTPTDLPATNTTIDLVRQHNAEDKIIYVVNGSNRFRATSDFLDFFREKHKGEIIHVIPQSEAFTQAKFRQQSVCEYSPKSPAAISIDSLVAIINKLLGLKSINHDL